MIDADVLDPEIALAAEVYGKMREHLWVPFSRSDQKCHMVDWRTGKVWRVGPRPAPEYPDLRTSVGAPIPAQDFGNPDYEWAHPTFEYFLAHWQDHAKG